MKPKEKAIKYLNEIDRLIINGKQYNLAECLEVNKAIDIAIEETKKEMSLFHFSDCNRIKKQTAKEIEKMTCSTH